MPENNKAPAHDDILVRDVSITAGGQPLQLQTFNLDDTHFDVAASGDRTATFHVTIPARRRITGSMSTSDDLVKWLRPEDAPHRTFELDHTTLAEAEEAAAADHHTPPLKFIGGDDEEP